MKNQINVFKSIALIAIAIPTFSLGNNYAQVNNETKNINLSNQNNLSKSTLIIPEDTTVKKEDDVLIKWKNHGAEKNYLRISYEGQGLTYYLYNGYIQGESKSFNVSAEVKDTLTISLYSYINQSWEKDFMTLNVGQSNDSSSKEGFTRDNEEEVVIDKKRKLMWQDDEEVETVRKYPQKPSKDIEDIKNINGKYDPQYYTFPGDTATKYCQDLALGGYEDWRLPSIEELETLIKLNTDQTAPHIYPIFQHILDYRFATGYGYFEYITSSNLYYQEDTVEIYKNPKKQYKGVKVGSVDFHYGNTNFSYIKDIYTNKYPSFVRCVRKLR